MATKANALVVLGLGLAAGAEHATWTATSGPVTVSVDTGSFAYGVDVAGGGQWLADGQVAMTCGGQRYSTSGGTNNLTGGAITVFNGTDRTLGDFSAVQRTWVRHFPAQFPPF